MAVGNEPTCMHCGEFLPALYAQCPFCGRTQLIGAVAVDEQLQKALDFLADQYQRYQLKADWENFTHSPKGSCWANRVDDSKSAVGSVLYLLYIELFGAEGREKARVIMDERRELAFQQWMDAMVEKFTIPPEWKLLRGNDNDDPFNQDFWGMFAKYRDREEA